MGGGRLCLFCLLVPLSYFWLAHILGKQMLWTCNKNHVFNIAVMRDGQ